MKPNPETEIANGLPTKLGRWAIDARWLRG
jgi:hypothetical protein